MEWEIGDFSAQDDKPFSFGGGGGVEGVDCLFFSVFPPLNIKLVHRVTCHCVLIIFKGWERGGTLCFAPPPLCVLGVSLFGSDFLYLASFFFSLCVHVCVAVASSNKTCSVIGSILGILSISFLRFDFDLFPSFHRGCLKLMYFGVCS